MRKKTMNAKAYTELILYKLFIVKYMLEISLYLDNKLSCCISGINFKIII